MACEYNPVKAGYGQGDYYCTRCDFLIEPATKQYKGTVNAMESFTFFISVYPAAINDAKIKKDCHVDEWFCGTCEDTNTMTRTRCNRCAIPLHAYNSMYDADNDVGFCTNCSEKSAYHIQPCCQLFAFKCYCAAAFAALLQSSAPDSAPNAPNVLPNVLPNALPNAPVSASPSPTPKNRKRFNIINRITSL